MRKITLSHLLPFWMRRPLNSGTLSGLEMRTVLLDAEGWRSTFAEPMKDVTENPEPVVDVWPYVAAVPPAELRSLAYRAGEVEHVYRSGDGRFDHVLIPTSARNEYLVVVVARDERSVHGHHVLDLNREYGLKAPAEVSQQALAICAAHAVDPAPPLVSSKLGIALATLGRDPLNGMRLHPEGGTCGWYVWGGELSDAPHFFQPLHVSHLSENCPSILPYLSLPPGWRFLLGANGYVDVWFDPGLLEG